VVSGGLIADAALRAKNQEPAENYPSEILDFKNNTSWCCFFINRRVV